MEYRLRLRIFRKVWPIIFQSCKNCLIGIDDVLIWIRDQQDHDACLCDVLNKNQAVDSTLNKQKTEFCQNAVIFRFITSASWRGRLWGRLIGLFIKANSIRSFGVHLYILWALSYPSWRLWDGHKLTTSNLYFKHRQWTHIVYFNDVSARASWCTCSRLWCGIVVWETSS